MLTKPRKILACGGLVGSVVLGQPACAQDVGPPLQNQGPGIDQLRQQLDEEQSQLAAQQQALRDAEKRLDEQKRSLQETQRRLDALRGQLGGPQPAASREGVQSEAPTAEQPVGQAPTEAPAPAQAVAPILEQPGVLTPRGKLVLEPSLQFSYSSNYQVGLVGYTIVPAVVIGLIDIQTVNSDTFVAALTGRYGLTNRLELDAKIPYVYRSQSTEARPYGVPNGVESLFSANGRGIGDVELGARYQFNAGGPNQPYYIGGLNFKTRTGKDPFSVPYTVLSGSNAALQATLPTGSGFYSIQPSLTAIYPSDPAVFFGGINYIWNFKRNVGNGWGEIDPGNAYGFNFGMGMSLNDKTSFSIGYEHTVVAPVQQNGQDMPGSLTSELGTLLFGYAYQLNPTTNINLTLGVGVTRYAPDVQVTLRVPMTF